MSCGRDDSIDIIGTATFVPFDSCVFAYIESAPCAMEVDNLGLERVAFDQIHVFTLNPEAAIAFANAFGAQSEFD